MAVAATEVASWYDAGMRLTADVNGVVMATAAAEPTTTEWPSLGGSSGYHRMAGRLGKPTAAPTASVAEPEPVASVESKVLALKVEGEAAIARREMTRVGQLKWAGAQVIDARDARVAASNQALKLLMLKAEGEAVIKHRAEIAERDALEHERVHEAAMSEHMAPPPAGFEWGGVF